MTILELTIVKISVSSLSGMNLYREGIKWRTIFRYVPVALECIKIREREQCTKIKGHCIWFDTSPPPLLRMYYLLYANKLIFFKLNLGVQEAQRSS